MPSNPYDLANLFSSGATKKPKTIFDYEYPDPPDVPSPSEGARDRRTATMEPSTYRVTGSDQGDALRKLYIDAGAKAEDVDAARIGREQFPGSAGIIAGPALPPREMDTISSGDDSHFAKPTKYGVLSEPEWYERFNPGYIAASAAAGLANGLYRQGEDMGNAAQATAKAASTGQPLVLPPRSKGFLPSGENMGAGVGEFVAEAPIELTKTILGKAANFVDDASKRGLKEAAKTAGGFDKDPVNIALLDGTAAKNEDGSSMTAWDSLVSGAKKAPGEVAGIGLAAWDMGRAGLGALGSIGDRSVSTKDKVDVAADAVTDIGTGMVRSLARTVLDPKEELNRGIVNTLLNATALGNPVKKLGVKTIEKKLGSVAAMEADGANVLARITKIDKTTTLLDSRVANLEKAAKESWAKAGQLSARIEFKLDPRSAAKEGNLIPLSLEEGGASSATHKAAMAEFKKASALQAKLDAARAQLDGWHKSAQFTVRNDLLKTGFELEQKIKKTKAYSMAADALSKVPSWVATGGFKFGYDALGVGIGRYIAKPGQGFERWLLLARDGRIPAELSAIEREVGGFARKDELYLQEAVRRIPLDKRPKVREFLQMEHRDWFVSGNDTSQNLIEWSDIKGQWHPTEKGFAAIAADKTGKIKQMMEADIWVANTWGTDLAKKSREITKQAISLGMFENAEQVRQLYWPQLFERKTLLDGSMSTQVRLAPGMEGHRLKGNSFRNGKNGPVVSIEDREAFHGLKTDLGDEAMLGLARFNYDVKTYELYNLAARDSKIAITEAEFQTRRKDWAKMHGVDLSIEGATTPLDKAWVQVPDVPRHPVEFPNGAKRYGKLGGMRLQEDVWFEFANAQAQLEQAHGWFPALIRGWKTSHTVLSAATHARNVLSNFLLFGPMAGLSILNPKSLTHFAQAVADVGAGKKSAMWRQAYEDGVFHGSFTKTELVTQGMAHKLSGFSEHAAEPFKRVMEMMTEAGGGAIRTMRAERGTRGAVAADAATKVGKNAWEAARGAVWDTPGALYGAEDDAFRLALYRQDLANGMSRADAAAHARRAFVDYENVPGFVAVARAPFAPVTRAPRGPRDVGDRMGPGAGTAWAFLGQPFLAFPTRSIPIMTDWFRRDPIRAQMWANIHDYMTGLGAAEAGLPQSTIEAMRRNLPDYEQYGYEPVAGLMPSQAFDENGDVRWVNTGYLSPFGNYLPQPNAYDNEEEAFFRYLKQIGLTGTNFLVSPIIQAAANVDRFGQQITPDGASNWESAAARINHVIGNELPPWTPSLTDTLGIGTEGPVGYPGRIVAGPHLEKLTAAVDGRPDHRGRERSVPETVLDVIGGVKTNSHRTDDLLFGSYMNLLDRLYGTAETSGSKTDIRSKYAAMEPEEQEIYATDYIRRVRPYLTTFRRNVEGLPLTDDLDLVIGHLDKIDEAIDLDEPTVAYDRIQQFTGGTTKRFGKLRKDDRRNADDMVRVR